MRTMAEQLKNDTSEIKWNLITYVDPHSLKKNYVIESETYNFLQNLAYPY